MKYFVHLSPFCAFFLFANLGFANTNELTTRATGSIPLAVSETQTKTEQLFNVFLKDLNAEIASQHLPSQQDVDQLLRKYGLSRESDYSEIYSQTQKAIDVLTSPHQRDYEAGRLAPEIRRQLAIYTLAISRDRFDMSLNRFARYSAVSNELYKGQQIAGVLTNGSASSRESSSAVLVLSPKEQLRAAVVAKIQEELLRTKAFTPYTSDDIEDPLQREEANKVALESSLQKHKDIAGEYKASLKFIDSYDGEIKPHHVELFYRTANLLRMGNLDIASSHNHFNYEPFLLELVKTVVAVKSPESATQARDLALRLYTTSNRYSLASNTLYLMQQPRYPFELKYGVGAFDIHTQEDATVLTRAYLQFVEMFDLARENKQLSQDIGNLLRNYFSYIKYDGENFNALSSITKDRLVIKDIYQFLTNVTAAHQRRRQIEIDVLNELTNRKEFFMSFDSEFINKGLEYILPRLQEGNSPSRIAEAIIRDIPVADSKGKYLWRSLSDELYPSKRELIDNALGKYFSPKGFLGLIAGAKRNLRDLIGGNQNTKPQLSNGTRTESIGNRSCRDIFK